MSAMVSTLVSRLRASCTPSRGTCQPPMPSCTRLVGRHVRQVGRPEPRRGVHALVEILFLDVDVAVEMDDADPLRRALRDAAHAGKADRVIAAEHDRQRAGRERHARRRGVIWSKLFSRLAGMVKTSPTSHSVICSRRSTPSLVIVGRVERRDAPDALRPEARAGAVGGAGVERDADDGGVVFATRRARSRHRAP